MPNVELYNVDKIDGGNAFSNYTPPSPTALVFEINNTDIEAISNGVENALLPYLKNILGLTQHNFRFYDQTYSNGLLTSGKIRIYETAVDTNTDSNPLKTYSITATYDGSNNLTSYKVIEF